MFYSYIIKNIASISCNKTGTSNFGALLKAQKVFHKIYQRDDFMKKLQKPHYARNFQGRPSGYKMGSPLTGNMKKEREKRKKVHYPIPRDKQSLFPKKNKKDPLAF